MPTINSIMPAGGGDYTTAQAWENAVDNSVMGDYIGECYEGGDCGTVTFGSWLTGSTGILRAAAGHEHNGDLTDGAYISSTSANCVAISVTSGITIQGMRLKKTGGSTAVLAVTNSTADIAGIVIDGNLIECARASAAALVGISISSQNYDMSGVVVRNNIVVTTASNGSGATGISVTHTQLNGGTKTLTADIHNNTIVCNSLGTYGLQAFPQQAISGTAAMNATIRNNVIVGATTACCLYTPSGATSGTITASNNATSDGTADAWGGSDHIENIVAADTFTDPAADWSILESSSLAEAGYDLSGSFTNDAYGNTRSVPWQIGAWGGTFPANDAPVVELPTGLKLHLGLCL